VIVFQSFRGMLHESFLWIIGRNGNCHCFFFYTCCRSLLRWREYSFFVWHIWTLKGRMIRTCRRLVLFWPRWRCAAEEAIVDPLCCASSRVSVFSVSRHAWVWLAVRFARQGIRRSRVFLMCIPNCSLQVAFMQHVCISPGCILHCIHVAFAWRMRVKHRALLWTRRLGLGLLVLPMGASGPSGYCGRWLEETPR
jgi:hypothetical protein